MGHGGRPSGPGGLRGGSYRSGWPRGSRKFFGVSAWLVAAVFLAFPAHGQPPQKTEVFFAQGQAVYYPDDRPRSQAEAAQDLVTSAVLQAVAGVLGPAGTQSMFGQIQEKLLSKKEKYVDGYQLASEGLVNGLYRVTGQVTVARELLIQDMRDMGFPVPPPPQPRVTDLVQGKPTWATPGGSPETQVVRPGRGPRSTRSMVAWAVAENWGSQWVLPDDVMAGGLPPFARCVLDKAMNLSWTPRFFPARAFRLGGGGRLAVEEVLAVSRQAGIEKVVTGRAWLEGSPPGNERVLAELEVLNATTGSSEAEIGGENLLQGAGLDAAVLRLAESLVPALDRALSGGDAAKESQTTSDGSGSPESWSVTLRAAHPQSMWEIVRREIESLFRDARTTGFEMEAERITVQVEGVDGRSLRDALEGREVSPELPPLRIEEFSEDRRTMTVGVGDLGERR